MAISLLKGSIVTRFATVWPAEKLTLEVPGGEPLSGYTIRTPPAFGWVTVTLSAKADGNVVHVALGLQPVLIVLGVITSVPCAGTAPAFAPRPTRVSTIRVGPSGRSCWSRRR